ncbi:hypothetical protein BC833DRAFT_594883 [Globomyces pollinis-pini]|nr:hypothetical protein BC833DRAFT_594883 [Globomyces pollinis-pini]
MTDREAKIRLAKEKVKFMAINNKLSKFRKKRDQRPPVSTDETQNQGVIPEPVEVQPKKQVSESPMAVTEIKKETNQDVSSASVSHDTRKSPQVPIHQDLSPNRSNLATNNVQYADSPYETTFPAHFPKPIEYTGSELTPASKDYNSTFHTHNVNGLNDQRLQQRVASPPHQHTPSPQLTQGYLYNPHEISNLIENKDWSVQSEKLPQQSYESYPNYENATQSPQHNEIKTLEDQCQYYSDMYQQVVALNDELTARLDETTHKNTLLQNDLENFKKDYNITAQMLVHCQQDLEQVRAGTYNGSRNTSPTLNQKEIEVLVNDRVEERLKSIEERATHLNEVQEWVSNETARLQELEQSIMQEREYYANQGEELQHRFMELDSREEAIKIHEKEIQELQEKLRQGQEWVRIEGNQLRTGQEALDREVSAFSSLKSEVEKHSPLDTDLQNFEERLSKRERTLMDALQVLERDRHEFSLLEDEFHNSQKSFKMQCQNEQLRLDQAQLEIEAKWDEIREREAQLQMQFKNGATSVVPHADSWNEHYNAKCQELEISNQELQSEKRSFQILREEAQKKIDNFRYKVLELENRENELKKKEQLLNNGHPMNNNESDFALRLQELEKREYDLQLAIEEFDIRRNQHTIDSLTQHNNHSSAKEPDSDGLKSVLEELQNLRFDVNNAKGYDSGRVDNLERRISGIESVNTQLLDKVNGIFQFLETSTKVTTIPQPTVELSQ